LSSLDFAGVDDLLDLSSLLITQTDDLVSALHPPHDTDELKDYISDVDQTVDAIAKTARASDEDSRWYTIFRQQYEQARDDVSNVTVRGPYN